MAAERAMAWDDVGALEPATVLAVDVIEGGDANAGADRDRPGGLRVLVRRGARAAASGGAASGEPARVASAEAPVAGDRVLVARDGDHLWVISVLRASRAAVRAPDGTEAALVGGAIELRDAAGAVLVRYEAGELVVRSPTGDLRLAAPAGHVVIEAGADVRFEAARDVVHHAGRRLDLSAGARDAPQVRLEPGAARVAAPKLEVEARTARLAAGDASVLARTIATTAERLQQNVGRYELTAAQIVEKARKTFREALDLAQLKAGRVKTSVRETYALQTRRTVLNSKDDTSIDGRKVLLG